MSIEQAAQLLGVSRRTVYNRIRDGKLQTIRTIGGSQRVLLTSLDEMRRLMLGRADGSGLSRVHTMVASHSNNAAATLGPSTPLDPNRQTS